MFKKNAIYTAALLFISMILVSCQAKDTSITAEPKETAKVESQTVYSLKDYEGTWTDTEFNQAKCDLCLNAIEINSTTQETGSLMIYVYNPYRLTNSSSEIHLQGNTATFRFDDDSGQGTGTLVLGQDQIKVKLNLDTADEKLKEVYSEERTLVREPYAKLTYYDPIELIREYARTRNDLQKLEFTLDEGVEWNEELNAGAELEVVIGKDSQGKILKRFSVNTLNKHIEEID